MPFAAPLAYVLAFVAVVMGVQTLAAWAFARSDQARRVNRRLTLLDSGMAPSDVRDAILRRSASANLSDARLNRLYERMATYLQQANLKISPPQLLLIVAGLAGVDWLLGFVLLSTHGVPPTVQTSLACLVGALMLSMQGVWMWVRSRRAKRLKQIEEQLPLALDIINRAVRAGHPVVSAVQLAAAEMTDPIGSQFGIIVDETSYGLEFKDALVSFARRTGSPDAHFFAVSVGIQAETGGSLADILEGLAAVIRGRSTLGKRVKALASEGKASAAILSALPVLLIGAMLLFQPSFYTDKFPDPAFFPTVFVIASVYGIGQLMIQRIINFKY